MRSLLLALFVAVSCQTGSPTSDTDEVEVVDLTGWRTEFVELPPRFAPDMPKGREVVMFAPGWPTQGAEDHWSYVILMEVEGTDWNAQRIEQLFELNYDGLMGAVGSGKSLALPDDPADCDFKHAGGSNYTGVVDTYDVFGDGAPLQLHLDVDVQAMDAATTQLRVAVSPHTSDYDPVWQPMRAALRGLTFP